MRSIKVKVVAYGKVRKYLDNRLEDTIEIDSDSSVRDLLRILEKPRNEIWMVNVNGLMVDEGYKLKDEDEVRIFEPIGGG